MPDLDASLCRGAHRRMVEGKSGNSRRLTTFARSPLAGGDRREVSAVKHRSWTSIGASLGVRLLVLLVLVGSIPARPSSASESAAAAYSFASSGWDGGNFQNVVAIAKNPSDTVIAGGDLSGLHRSVNLGVNWEGANEGLTVPGKVGSSAAFAVATILVHPGDPNTFFVGAGREGEEAGFYVSTDAGVTWTRRSPTPAFSGKILTGSTLGRPVGTLIGFHSTTSTLFAATLNGLMRSTDGGSTWVTLGLGARKLRGLAMDPNGNGEVIYLAVTDDKVYKATNARSCSPGSCSISILNNSRLNTEELLALNDGGTTYVYAAAGTDGVYRSSNGGSTWQARNSGLPVTGPLWGAIAGSGLGGTATLYVGARDPVQSPPGTSYDALFKSTNGGGSWTSVTDSGITTTLCGSTRSWWEATSHPQFMLGGPTYTATHIAIDPSNSQRVVVAGKSGLWSSSTGGTSWCPLVNGLMVAQARDIVADPNVAGRYYTGSADFGFFASTDSMANVTQQSIPGGGANVIDIALDTAATPTSTVYVSNGNDDVLDWDVFSNPNPVSPSGSWSSLGLRTETGGLTPNGLAVRRVSGTPVVLTGVGGGGVESGIWRYSGSPGTWAKVNTTAMQDPKARASTAWLSGAGSAWVYLYDSHTGLWQSGDNGATWTRKSVNISGHLGFLVADPAVPDRIYLSIEQEGVFRIDDADQSSISPTPIGSFSYPGPIGLKSTGTIYVTEYLATGSPSRIWYSTDAGANWTEATDGYYRRSGYVPMNLVIASDGKVYVAVSSGGAIIGTP